MMDVTENRPLLHFAVCYLLEQVEEAAFDGVVVVVGTGDLVPDVFRAVGFEHFVV